MKLWVLLLVPALAATAGEYAVLVSGARLRVDRHEVENGQVRLYKGGGTTELPASQVAGFEREEEASPEAQPATPAPVPAPEPADPRKLVDEIARKYSLPREFLHSVVLAESAYRPHVVSPKGAIGLMQLMPVTAKAYGADAWDPAQNLDAGARYLSELLVKYNGGVWHALAAYNAGPGAVEKYNGIPPYRETREYVERILKNCHPASW